MNWRCSLGLIDHLGVTVKLETDSVHLATNRLILVLDRSTGAPLC